MQQFSPFSDSVGKSFVDAYASGSSILRHYLHALGDDIGDRERWYDPKVCRGLEGWSAYEVPKGWYGELEAVDGIVWFRRYIELPASASGSPAALRIPGVDDSDSTYVNGVLVGSNFRQKTMLNIDCQPEYFAIVVVAYPIEQHHNYIEYTQHGVMLFVM